MCGSTRQFLNTLARASSVALVVYSLVHFIYSGIGKVDCRRSDFASAFPGPYASEYNPALLDQFSASVGDDWGRHRGIWNYGPILHALTLPLTLVQRCETAWFWWTLANLLFSAASAILLFMCIFGPIQRTRWPILVIYAALWLNFYPFLEAFRQGNIELFELLLLIAAYRGMQRSRSTAGTNDEALAGALIGGAVMTKFLPAMFFPYFAVKRWWKALVASLLMTVLIATGAQFALDWRKSLTMQQFMTNRFAGSTSPQSQSLTGLVLRGFATFPDGLTRTHDPKIPPAQLGSAIQTSRTCIAIVLSVFAILLWLRRRTAAMDLEWAMLLALMIFIPPWNQDYYQVFLLFPFTVLLKRAWEAKTDRISHWVLLAMLYVSTSSVIIPSSWIDRAFGQTLYSTKRLFQNLSLPALGNLGILLWLGVLYWRSHGEKADA